MTDRCSTVPSGTFSPCPVAMNKPSLSHLIADSGRFLSAQTFDAGGALKRSTWVLYEADKRPTAYLDQQELMNVNRREVSSRTVFNDDNNRYAG